jgi:hypothetical protein
MELWQRLKDLEKKVAEHEAKLNAPVVVGVDFGVKPSVAVVSQTWEEEKRALIPKIHEHNDRVDRAGPSLCVKCGKVPGYYFHVKYCKGNAEVA